MPIVSIFKVGSCIINDFMIIIPSNSIVSFNRLKYSVREIEITNVEVKRKVEVKDKG